MYSQLSDFQKLSIRSDYWSGMPVTDICKKYGISKTTAYFWISPTKHKDHYMKVNGKDIIVQKEYCDNQRKMDRYKKIVSILEDANCNAESPLEDRLSEFIRLSPVYGINVTLDALHISKGTYHNRIKCGHNPTSYEKHHQEISHAVQLVFDESKQCYGADKILAVLQKRGYHTSKKYILSIMHELGLQSVRVHSKKDYRRLNKINKVKRKFDTSEPNKIWVSDITQFLVKDYYYYICTIMDLYSRKIVGYKISTNASTQLATSTFRKAFKNRGCPAGLMFHSDNGGQYTSRAFRSLLVNCNVEQSFSRPHTPIDNAVAESFFANLKREEIYRHEYRSEREFRDRIDKYINNYNRSRPHRHNNYKSPDEKEAVYYAIKPE